MSLYLQTTVGGERYLLDAARILEIRLPEQGEGAVHWQDKPVPVVDLRELFGEVIAARGCCVLFAQASGEPAALLVDDVDGLVDVGEGEFCMLPPIGPVGLIIDAISTRLADGRPVLRLRGERALAAAGEFAAGPDLR